MHEFIRFRFVRSGHALLFVAVCAECGSALEWKPKFSMYECQDEHVNLTPIEFVSILSLYRNAIDNREEQIILRKRGFLWRLGMFFRGLAYRLLRST